MLKRVQVITVLLVIMLTVSGCRSEKKIDFHEEKTTAAGSTQKGKKIFVYVCGCVRRPGVYSFSSGERMVAAIKAAGGMTPDAAPESINQARKMQDGQQILVPSRKDRKRKQNREGQDSSSGKVNINTAGKEQLMSLAGIGESKAEDIIAYREEHGPFSKTEDIMKIQGIKEGIYKKIKDNIII